ncbi:MAG: hypothetical protein ABF991_11460 [Liquorilactobacillus hordei]|uniref:hypothetical protein n=1 Tax=Liquorilactobacillus hordei TaxID=468911 RepID=UPI0039EC4280
MTPRARELLDKLDKEFPGELSKVPESNKDLIELRAEITKSKPKQVVIKPFTEKNLIKGIKNFKTIGELAESFQTTKGVVVHRIDELGLKGLWDEYIIKKRSFVLTNTKTNEVEIVNGGRVALAKRINVRPSTLQQYLTAGTCGTFKITKYQEYVQKNER